MAWWLSWLERRPVTAEVVGSNPIRVAVFITEYFLTNGILAQLGEHLPYKQRVIGSSPIVSTTCGEYSFSAQIGRVVQLVRTPACHAGGRGFEPLLGRQYAAVAQ